MNKYIISACLLLNLSFSGIGQSPATIKRIETFCKVWGFLKYHHPSIAAGKLDWDSVFISHVQPLIHAKNNIQLNDPLLEIINSAGDIPELKEKKTIDNSFELNNQGIDWISRSTLLADPVKKKLKFIYTNKKEGSNKYFKVAYSTGDFSGENKYDGMSFPDTRYRLLFLSRFWNIINYFSPYKYLTTDWDTVLERFIPKVINVTDPISYYKVLMELCKSLNDGHSQLTLPRQMSFTDLVFGNLTAPFYCDIVAGKVIIRAVFNDSIAKARNFQAGDIVLKVDGKDVNELIRLRRKYISASNVADEMHQLSQYILDGHDSVAKLDLLRNNKIIHISVTRSPNSKRNWGALINYTYNDVGYKN